MPEYCVTGGTGFIASHLIRALLAAGHSVRATVRDPEDEGKVGFLWDLEGAAERLQLVRADLMVEGSFDDAVSGVDGVFHTASPVVVVGSGGIGNGNGNGNGKGAAADDDVQETLVAPIVKGAANVLRSCARSAPERARRRVVFTSSCSCVRYCHGAATLNESHWTDAEYCKSYNLWYAYAKTVAEKEAWRLAKEHGIDLVVVNPSFVIGPALGPKPTSTILIVLAMLRGELCKYPNTTIGFAHVDDVVLCHVLAMEDARASGRLICSGEVAQHWSEVLESLRERYPQYPIPTECSGSQKGDDRPHRMDTSKVRALGFPPFLSVQQMFDDCIKSFQDKGLLSL